MRFLLKALAGALLLAGVVGLSYEAIAEHRDRGRFPQRGWPVDAAGRKLNLVCSGRGSPTVVLEAGMIGLVEMWSPVQAAVSTFTRVCSYDRAAYGWSEPGPLPRISRQIAQELHIALAKAESLAEDAEEVRNSGTLEARPLIVLTGGRNPDPEVRRIWVNDLQAGMAQLSSRGRQIVLNDSGHEILFEDPDAVAAAIREVAAAVRN